MQHPPCFFTISNRLLLGGNCVKEKKYLDFLGGLVLLMLSVIIIIASVLMHIKSGEAFYLSPGLMPMILGIALLFCSLFYFAESLKDGGFSARICETREWFHAVVSDKTTHSMAVGVIIMAVYTFLLMSFLPFWLSSLIFMIILMGYLKAESPVKILLISGGAVALIVLLFQVLFRVPLP